MGLPAEVEELEDLVEGGRVAGSRGHHREGPLETRHEIGRAERLTGPHPVAVAGQGVDLTVVGHVAVRMGQRPRREGVGREARVDEGQPAGQPLVGQIGEEVGQLVRGEHALVGDGPGRERREVAVVDLVLGPLPQDEGQPVEGQGRIARVRAACPRTGPRRAGASRACRVGDRPEHVLDDRDLPPAEYVEPFLGGQLPDQGAGGRRPHPGHGRGRRCRWRTGRDRAAGSRPTRR